MINYSRFSFKEKMEMEAEMLFMKAKKYNRTEASKLIGFSQKRGAFTEFLLEHRFICIGGFPNPYLLEKKLMSYTSKDIFEKRYYDSNDFPIGFDERDDRRIVKNITTPLFTESGIKFMKKIISEPEFFKSELLNLEEFYITPLNKK